MAVRDRFSGSIIYRSSTHNESMLYFEARQRHVPGIILAPDTPINCVYAKGASTLQHRCSRLGGGTGSDYLTQTPTRSAARCVPGCPPNYTKDLCTVLREHKHARAVSTRL